MKFDVLGCLKLVVGLVFWFINTTVVAQPNVIVIMTDDQGFGDFGVTGNTVLDTPNIDKLASQSVTFDRFYVSPVCTPTRASLMTGRYHQRTGAVDTWRGGAMMRPDEVTMAEAMRAGGYATGIFGKWHLGDCYPMRAMDQGFDHALVHQGGGLAQPSEPIENRKRYTDPILFRNGEEIQTKGYCTDVYFSEAINFIVEKVQDRKPFFAYIATNAPHGPFHDVPKDLYEKYRATDLSPILLGHEGDADVVARIFAMVENVDQNVGRLINELDRLGIADNTVVVFMVDNGPNTRRYVGDMRGKKSEVHDGGVRSPLFIRYPAKFKAGRRVMQNAAHIDIMPTLLDVAGVDKPEGVKFDGRSLLRLITAKPGANVSWDPRTIVIQAHRGNSSERFHNCMVINDHWKLVRPSGFGKQKVNGAVQFELYNIDLDPKESKNLAGEQASVCEKLKTDYLAWHADISGSIKERPRIEVASRHQPKTVLTRQDWLPHDPGWGSRGRWLVTSKNAKVAKVTVLLRVPMKENGPANLTVGEEIYVSLFKQGQSSVVFDNIELPEGDFEVEAIIDRQGQVVGPWHLVVERVNR